MSFRAFLCGITRNLALKKLEWRQAAKRRCPGTVSLEELENLLPDERFAPDASGEEIGACINAFLAQEPKEARRSFYGATGILILWQTLPAGTASPRAR